jgi:hypothetical protein
MNRFQKRAAKRRPQATIIASSDASQNNLRSALGLILLRLAAYKVEYKWDAGLRKPVYDTLYGWHDQVHQRSPLHKRR